MNRTCKTFCLLLGLALALFALPSVAGNDKKIVTVVMSSPPDQAPLPYVLQATVTNDGNSTVNSFQLTYTGSFLIVGVQQPASGNATFTSSSVTVKNMSPLKSGASFTLTIDVGTCGDDPGGKWGASVWTGSQLNGQSFALAGDSNLNTSVSCGDPKPGDALSVPNIFSCELTGQRGYYDKDGTVGAAVPYFVTVTNPNPANEALHFRWPDFQGNVRDPLAAFEYTICGSGPLPEVSSTTVAWLNTDGSPASTAGTPAYLPAQGCLLPDVLPTPYGTLLANLGPSDIGTISIDTTTPSGANGTIPYPGTGPVNPATPGSKFDVVIGTERITVQLVCLDNDNDTADSEDCTEGGGEGTALQIVQRGVSGTAPAAHVAGPGVLVMSTPLPILPSSVTCSDGAGNPLPACPYTPLTQALMCVAERFNEEGGGHATTFFDIGGDGHVTGP
jgi:hypothetical protein